MHTDRRTFIRSSGAAVGTALLGATATGAARVQVGRTYRAAIIGRTGAGGYGHGYETVFSNLPNVTVEAIADVDPEGLKKAAERSGAKRQYLDYREMLAKEKPDLVCIATRHPNYHKEMALAAIEVGAHLFIEKPLADSLAEADEILKAAEARRLKIAMAHSQRLNSGFKKIKALIAEGFIGTPIEVRGSGSQDARVGGEDLIVLGTHEFDIVRWYFGDPLWCQASVTVGGRDMTKADVRRGLGDPVLVAGDSVRATYAFPHNVQFHWNSVKSPDRWPSKRGLTFVGSERIIAFYHGPGPCYLDSTYIAHTDEKAVWRPLPEPKNPGVPDHERSFARSLIHAIETNTQPLFSGDDGRWTVEMVAAAYESQRTKARVDFPLQERRHPLTLL